MPRLRLLVMLLALGFVVVPDIARPAAVRAADPARFMTWSVDQLSTGEHYHRSWETPGTTAIFAATGSGEGVRLRAEDASGTGEVEFFPPIGGSLEVGTYMVTAAAPNETTGAMTVTQGSTLCRPDSGSFAILEAPASDDAGFLTGFAVTFEADCGNDRLSGVAGVSPSVPVKALVIEQERPLDFGTGTVGIASAPLTSVVRNVGTADVAIEPMVTLGTQPDAFIATDDCGTLGPGSSCTVSIRFRPTNVGLQTARIEIPSDDVTIARRLIVFGTGQLVEATNTTPATAAVIDPLPFVHGGLTVPESYSNSCGEAGPTLWYRYTSDAKRRIRFESQTSAATPELFQGTASSLTSVQCGSNPGLLDFTAQPGVTYWIKLVTIYPTTDRAIVRVTEADPDPGVQASTATRAPATFYPYRDGYLDSVTVRGNRGEPIAVQLRVYSSANRIVRYLTLPFGSGVYTLSWNGRSASGAQQPAGTYRLQLTMTDTWGNAMVQSLNVSLSAKRLYLRTYSRTLDAGTYRASGTIGTGRVSRSASRYAGGVKLTAGSSGAASVAYNFSLPAAATYRSVRFYALGVGRIPPADIGLQRWSVCTRYDTSCVDPWSSAPISYGWSYVRGGASNVSGARLVRGYVRAASSGGGSPYADVRDVRLVVSYGILR